MHDGHVPRATTEDDDLALIEEVERRRELRGTFPGLRIALWAPRVASFEAVEASRRSFFVRAVDPDSFRLGELFEARVEHGGRAAACRLEVIRKELHPRAGVALRLHSIEPRDEAVLRDILGPLAAPA